MAMAKRRIYTAEMLAWLRDYAKGRWLEEITDGFNEHFGTEFEPKKHAGIITESSNYIRRKADTLEREDTQNHNTRAGRACAPALSRKRQRQF